MDGVSRQAWWWCGGRRLIDHEAVSNHRLAATTTTTPTPTPTDSATCAMRSCARIGSAMVRVSSRSRQCMTERKWSRSSCPECVTVVVDPAVLFFRSLPLVVVVVRTSGRSLAALLRFVSVPSSFVAALDAAAPPPPPPRRAAPPLPRGGGGGVSRGAEGATTSSSSLSPAVRAYAVPKSRTASSRSAVPVEMTRHIRISPLHHYKVPVKRPALAARCLGRCRARGKQRTPMPDRYFRRPREPMF